MFLKFDKQAIQQFGNFVKVVANISLQNLSSRQQNVALITPIDFYSLFAESQHQSQPNNNHVQEPMESMEDIPIAQDEPSSPGHQVHRAAVMVPKFKNTSNNCWFNSVLQIIIYALKNKGDAVSIGYVPFQHDHLWIGNILIDEIRSFLVPGTYDVNSLCKTRLARQARQKSIKQEMLISMGFPSASVLDNQYDAAQCLQTLLGITLGLDFLWHIQEERLQCENVVCGNVTRNEVPNAVVHVDISSSIHQRTFDGAAAIKRFLETTENGIERRCPDCHANTCSKTVSLPEPPKFIVVQFKRFMVGRTRNATKKIDTASNPFSFVEINTGQGSYRYDVVASIEHIGMQLQYGHYISYVNCGNIWYECNDERITPLGAETEAPTRKAYILLLKLTVSS